MAVEAKSAIWYVTLGNIKYAWYAKDAVYKDVAAALGVTKAKDTDDNLVFGTNSPKPPKVRISLANRKSYVLFCDPDKLNELIAKGSANGKKYRGQNINRVSLAR